MDAPTASELFADPVVQQALAEAWADSEVSDPTHRHEEGGWIYQDVATGQRIVRRAARGVTDAIDLSQPPSEPGFVVVGKFHTHPNPSADGWEPGPSMGDLWVDALHGVPDLIRSDQGDFVSGPDRRRGGLAGPPGFPD